jgi:hypothetical protein
VAGLELKHGWQRTQHNKSTRTKWNIHFEVLIVVVMKIQCHVDCWRSTEVSKEHVSVHLPNQRVSQVRNSYETGNKEYLTYSSVLEATCSSETLADFQWTTRNLMPEIFRRLTATGLVTNIVLNINLNEANEFPSSVNSQVLGQRW